MEADLAKPVLDELRRQRWTTYEEVSCGYGGKRADIVATRGKLVMVVELKDGLTLKLLDQLLAWTGHAHYVVGAVPHGKQSAAARHFLEQNGFGLWVVGEGSVSERVAPRLHRRAGAWLRKSLREEQRSGAYLGAGSTGGGYFTPFQGTCKALRDHVLQFPGCTLKQALDAAGHHYASTKSALGCLPPLIRQGVVVGVRLDDTVRPARLYPVTQPLSTRTHGEENAAAG